MTKYSTGNNELMYNEWWLLDFLNRNIILLHKIVVAICSDNRSTWGVGSVSCSFNLALNFMDSKIKGQSSVLHLVAWLNSGFLYL